MIGLIRITAERFCAGVETDRGVVVRAAPILSYMMGWTAEHVISYAKAKRWTVEALGAVAA